MPGAGCCCECPGWFFVHRLPPLDVPMPIVESLETDCLAPPLSPATAATVSMFVSTRRRFWVLFWSGIPKFPKDKHNENIRRVFEQWCPSIETTLNTTLLGRLQSRRVDLLILNRRLVVDRHDVHISGDDVDVVLPDQHAKPKEEPVRHDAKHQQMQILSIEKANTTLAKVPKADSKEGELQSLLQGIGNHFKEWEDQHDFK